MAKNITYSVGFLVEYKHATMEGRIFVQAANMEVARLCAIRKLDDVYTEGYELLELCFEEFTPPSDFFPTLQLQHGSHTKIAKSSLASLRDTVTFRTDYGYEETLVVATELVQLYKCTQNGTVQLYRIEYGRSASFHKVAYSWEDACKIFTDKVQAYPCTCIKEQELTSWHLEARNGEGDVIAEQKTLLLAHDEKGIYPLARNWAVQQYDLHNGVQDILIINEDTKECLYQGDMDEIPYIEGLTYHSGVSDEHVESFDKNAAYPKALQQLDACVENNEKYIW